VPFTHHGAKAITQSKVDMQDASPYYMSLDHLGIDGMKVYYGIGVILTNLLDRGEPV